MAVTAYWIGSSWSLTTENTCRFFDDHEPSGATEELSRRVFDGRCQSVDA